MRTTLTLDEDVAGGLLDRAPRRSGAAVDANVLLYAYDPRAPITRPRGSGCGRVVLGPAGATRPDHLRSHRRRSGWRVLGKRALARAFTPRATLSTTCELGCHSERALKPYPDYKDSSAQVGWGRCRRTGRCDGNVVSWSGSTATIGSDPRGGSGEIGPVPPPRSLKIHGGARPKPPAPSPLPAAVKLTACDAREKLPAGAVHLPSP